MNSINMLNNKKLKVSSNPPYDSLQSFVRENHIALEGSGEGSLKGLVFGVKDVFRILGSTWGNGHPEWLRTSSPDEFTSSMITKILEEGADLVGKTICDELCFSISGENWNYGSPINPNDTRRLTGGSSSGSAAATAGGLVDFALGSDCLGSVRVPASYNGVLGIRPTYGRVPNDGEVKYCDSMDVLGYVAGSPSTFKTVSKVILGEDKQKAKFKKLLIAKDCFNMVNQDVKEALQPAVDYIAGELDSVEEVEVSIEGLDDWVKTFRIIQGYEVWESYGGWIKKHNPYLPPGQKERLQWVSTITMKEYKKALIKMEMVIKRMKELIPLDTILCLPTAASIAPLKSTPLEDIKATRLQSSALLCISALSGTPQITLPMINQEDVPLGISLIGARGTDLALVEFSADIVEKYLKP